MVIVKKKKPSFNGMFYDFLDNSSLESDVRTRVMLDASIRRFKIQQVYLKASAALRWVNSRNAILGTNRPQSIHTPALLQITNTMRSVSLPSLYYHYFSFSSFLFLEIACMKLGGT
jgi:hypothetical protein